MVHRVLGCFVPRRGKVVPDCGEQRVYNIPIGMSSTSTLDVANLEVVVSHVFLIVA